MPEMYTITRRKLLKGAAAAGIVGPFFSGRVLGANDRVNMAVVGIRGQGQAHVSGFPAIKGVQLKTLCDIDENVWAERVKLVQDKHGYAPGTEWDMRRVFDDKDIDAVSFATPNHWHALGTIWAAQAGKHIYVEKPACHTVWEGRQMVHAARKHKVAVQVGFQNRSRESTRAAMAFLADGKLGKIYAAKGLCYKSRPNIGRWPDGPMSADSKYRFTLGGAEMQPYTAAYLDKVHYDRWIGPAAVKPFNPNRFHYNWHWQWAYGNGDTGNQGPHQFDVARWGLGKEEYPVKISSKGGVYLFEDSQQETPNTQVSLFQYADGTLLTFETRGHYTNTDGKIAIGNIFYGSEGRLEIDAEGKWQVYLGPKSELGPSSEVVVQQKNSERSDATKHVGSGLEGHLGNFVDAVRGNNPAALNCDIEVGYRSSVLPAIANIAYRVGEELKFDGKTERFVGNAKANALLHRQERKDYRVPNLGRSGLPKV